MRWFLLIIPAILLVGCELEEFEGEEDYGPNHALILEGGLKFKADCLSCHARPEYEEEEGGLERPMFRYAGTVWDRPNGDPLPGVRVILKAVGAGDSLVLTTDGYGNLKTSSSLSTAQYYARVECPGGKVLAMRLHPYHGGCNDCHRPGGKAGNVLSCDK